MSAVGTGLIIAGSIGGGAMLGSAAIGALSSASSSAANAKMLTKTIYDPTKAAVATPLSSYLASQVGQGLPSYTGEMVAPLPQGGGASVAPFLSMTSQQLINQTNAAAENEFKNSFDANVAEPFAGRMSGSGAGASANASETALQLGLAQQDIGIEENLPKAQMGVAQSLANQQTAIDQAAYQNWFTSLPQNNPALTQALQFLQNSTNTGTTTLAALNAGSQSIYPSIMSAGASIYGSYAQAQAMNNMAESIQGNTYGNEPIVQPEEDVYSGNQFVESGSAGAEPS